MPGTSGVPQKLTLLLVFFNIFIINMDNKAESTFNVFSNDKGVAFFDKLGKYCQDTNSGSDMQKQKHKSKFSSHIAEFSVS